MVSPRYHRAENQTPVRASARGISKTDPTDQPASVYVGDLIRHEKFWSLVFGRRSLVLDLGLCDGSSQHSKAKVQRPKTKPTQASLKIKLAFAHLFNP